MTRMRTNVCLEYETSSGIVRFSPGEVFAPRELHPIVELIGEGKVDPASNCYVCGEFFWWLSIHGVLICGICHPPAASYLVKRWIDSANG